MYMYVVTLERRYGPRRLRDDDDDEYASPPKQAPWAIFLYKIRRGEGVPGPWPREKKLHDCGFKNVGLLAPKSPKLVFFGINVPKKGYIPLSDFYKVWLDGLVDQLPSPHPLAKFNHCHF